MTAERVYQLRALPDQKIPRPEQHGARLLSLGLNRDKAHRRSTCSLSNRFRVSRIVLLTLDERFDVGGWDQSNLMPEVTDGPPQWCALPQASMATMQRGCSAKKPRTFSRESFLRNPTPPSARAPCAWKDRFARSRPIMLTLSMDALSVRGMRNHHHLGTSRCRQEGHPLHHLSPAAGRRRRIRLAKAWPNLRAHCRTLSWLTMMPRAASISSTIRKLSGKRK